MIVEIQENLKQIIVTSTGLSENIIVTEEINTSANKTFPWISIIPELATITPAWHKDPFFSIEDIPSIVIRKYNISQAILITLEFINKGELSKVVNDIFIGLPKQIIINDIVVYIEPKQIEYFFTKEEVKPYKGLLKINMNYFVRENPVTFGRIKDIETSLNYELI